MNILSVAGLVPWHPGAGGGQIIAYKISEALARAEEDVHHLAIAPEGSQRQADSGAVRYTYLDSGPGVLASLPCAIQLATSARVDEYDIVHVHSQNETVGWCLGYAVARRIHLKPKFAISIYAPKVYAFPRSVGEIIAALSCHSADLIFSLSEFSKRDISRAYRLPLGKIAVTYAGVDSSFAAENRSFARESTDPFVLLYCGRLNGPREQKGIDVLLGALPLVLRHYDVVLDIVGTGGRLDQYRRLAHQLGVTDKVNFLGFVEHALMPSEYARADLFVLPSRRESFGLVLAEAMAWEVPVVATTAGAIPEVVEDRVTGVLVPPDDPQALADAINELLSDPQRRRTMGIAARDRVEKYFTWDRVAERVIEGYQRVL